MNTKRTGHQNTTEEPETSGLSPTTGNTKRQPDVQAERPKGTRSRRAGMAWLRPVLTGENVTAAAVFVALFYVPYLVAGYTVFILPQYMLFGVLALTLGLLWGFGGMVSFGQAAFFALGAYALGVVLQHVDHQLAPWLGILLALGIGVLVSGAIGYFLFSADVRDSYFVLVTLAISTIVYVLANAQSELTGGFNGMFVERINLPLGLADLSLAGDVAAYYVIFVFTLATYMGFRLLVASKFGRILVSIRENEDRSRALGYNTAVVKTAAFAISGGVAALAGSLYATDTGFISPSLGSVLASTNVVVWVAVGGRHYLIGAFVGALGISWLSNELNARLPELWQLILGLMFLSVVMFLRRGVIGTALHTLESRGERR